MSDAAAKSYNNCDGKAGQHIHPYQSAWMAHWAGTTCEESPQMHNHSSCPRDHNITPQNLLTGLEITSDITRSAKGFREMEQRNAENMYKGLAARSKNLTNESLGGLSFPTGQESGKGLSSKNERDISCMHPLRPKVSRGKLPATLNILSLLPPAAATSTRDCRFQPEGVFQIPAEQVKYHMFFGESHYSCSKEKTIASASHIVPNSMDNDELKQVTSIVASKQQVSKINRAILEQGHSNHQSHSALLVCEEKISNFPKSEKSVTPYLRQNNTAQLMIGPSSSTYKLAAYGEGQCERTQNPFGNEFLPAWSSRPSEMTKPGKLQHEQCSLQSIPHFVHDVLDSTEGLSGGLQRFSQTTHSVFITKHTDIKMFNENQILRESRRSNQLKQNTFCKLQQISPLFSHGKQGVKLQLLGSSTDSDEKEDAGHVKAFGAVQKNESSAETNTMDMESLKEKGNVSGVHSSPSNEDMLMDPSLAPQAASTMAIGCRKRPIELPDMNLELPAAAASSSSIEKPESSPSRTQSLDMDLYLCNADKRGSSKADDRQYGHPEPEPSSTWVKRLKLTSPNTPVLGTESSNLGEPFSHEKVNEFSSKIMKGTTSSPQPTVSQHPGKELMALDQMAVSLKKAEPSSTEMEKEGHGITLSHSWIQRWRHNQPKKKFEAVVTYDPQSSKLAAIEDFQKKQFPSIAAMALMGKVMTGFQPCEFQKKGSSIVWNTKG